MTYLRVLVLSALVWGVGCAGSSGVGGGGRVAGGEGADVVVYGATPGGVCAAIAAAREGASVVLVEPTGHVGGVNTGGLSFSDSNQTVRSTLMGLFDEWHRRIEADYARRGVRLPYEVGVKDHRPWTYEPGVAARVTRRMLDEAGVRVVTGRVLVSVEKEGTVIRAVVTTGGRFQGKVFVDGTYEGDLMAAAGVSWTIGREGRAEYGESLAGKRYPKKVMAISGFGGDGELLPLVTTADAGAEEAGDRNVMTYSFRLCLTNDPANRVPMPAPAKYDPARFEVVRRYFRSDPRAGMPWDLYPLPGGKVDANNGIGKQFSMGLVGAGRGWCEADAAGRAAIWEAHRQYTLEMYRFLTTDEAVPEGVRRRLGEYGLCRDEFAEYGHWSPQLYVREGRRMRGAYVLSQRDVQESREKEDAIAVSSFPIDSHDCQRVALPGGGGVVDEGTIFPVRLAGRRHGSVYQVPLRSVVPAASECTNLVVPVALSATHVAYSSIRVEPTWMAVGQGAGVAAALAATRGTAVQGVPYGVLRERLVAQGQVLELPVLAPVSADAGTVDPAGLPGIVIDDSAAEKVGTWVGSKRFRPYVGVGYVHDDQRGDGRSVIRFRVVVPETGRYELGVAYSAHETRAKRVPVTVEGGGAEGPVRFELDETRALGAGEVFGRVGAVELVAGREATVTISNAGTEGFVVVDAIQLVRTGR